MENNWVDEVGWVHRVHKGFLLWARKSPGEDEETMLGILHVSFEMMLNFPKDLKEVVRQSKIYFTQKSPKEIIEFCVAQIDKET